MPQVRGPRVLYDFMFFLLIIVIILNIVFGIIIDTFAQIRDHKHSIEEDSIRTCMICGIRCGGAWPGEEAWRSVGAGQGGQPRSEAPPQGVLCTTPHHWGRGPTPPPHPPWKPPPTP